MALRTLAVTAVLLCSIMLSMPIGFLTPVRAGVDQSQSKQHLLRRNGEKDCSGGTMHRRSINGDVRRIFRRNGMGGDKEECPQEPAPTPAPPATKCPPKTTM
ncbi:hypothetical protein H4R33_001257 [Dimargaris cristalligena]|uniref:Uncharacterized protein n=1 Tax=Dimargaris cristalligena TaxID=215637 RepID=A0A4P9ZT75_9FUNG|nr:hypothetical protein H4R33_001257 [Dimargaris cristalligena]RKP36655.1 hypothetical protein BJ085DRAFT_28885 [Dimargaris cristalligena]|eukprot:RKP36655.1 hypothetical protein BJ085DRAFT_28885 [Dimargaris cristalligena]